MGRGFAVKRFAITIGLLTLLSVVVPCVAANARAAVPSRHLVTPSSAEPHIISGYFHDAKFVSRFGSKISGPSILTDHPVFDIATGMLSVLPFPDYFSGDTSDPLALNNQNWTAYNQQTYNMTQQAIEYSLEKKNVISKKGADVYVSMAPWGPGSVLDVQLVDNSPLFFSMLHQ